MDCINDLYKMSYISNSLCYYLCYEHQFKVDSELSLFHSGIFCFVRIYMVGRERKSKNCLLHRPYRL